MDRSPLAERNFRLALTSVAVSTGGDWLYNVALFAFVFEATQSTSWVAAAGILRLVPYVLFGPYGGVVADRFDRRRVMVASDLVRAALMFGLAAIANFSLHPSLALAAAFACTTAGTPYLPALTALTPRLVPETSLARANALLSSVENVALLIGPALGALLLVAGSPTTAFAVNGVTFLLSAAFAAGMRLTGFVEPIRKRRQGAMSGDGENAGAGRAGLRALAQQRDSLILAVLMTGIGFIYGTQTVLLVLLSEQTLGWGPDGFGWLMAAVGGGGLVAATLGNRISSTRRPAVVMAGALCTSGVAYGALTWLRDPPAVLAAMALDGAATIVAHVLIVTTLQRTIRSDLVGRVFGAVEALDVAAMVAGSIVATLAYATLGLKGALLACAVLVPAATLALLPALRAAGKHADQQRAALAPRVRILQSSAIFDGAPLPALEMLAGLLAEEKAAANTIVVAHGEEAHDFYVVVNGTLEVLSPAGQRLAELSGGDHFGEIGIVNRTPRVATVRTVTPCTLYRIPAASFIGAIGNSRSIQGSLRESAAGRLSHNASAAAPSDTSAP